MKKCKNQQGFSLIELILTIIIIGILAAIGYAQYVNLRTSSEAATCKANQMSLETCQGLYYIDHALNGNPHYTTDLDDLIPYMKAQIDCPSGGTYKATSNGQIQCSITAHHRPR